MTTVNYLTISDIAKKITGSKVLSPLPLTGKENLISLWRKAIGYDAASESYFNWDFWFWGESDDEESILAKIYGDVCGWLLSHENEITEMLAIKSDEKAGQTQIVRFNDTPQTAGDFTTVDHTTTITKTETSINQTARERRDNVFSAEDYYVQLIRSKFSLAREAV